MPYTEFESRRIVAEFLREHPEHLPKVTFAENGDPCLPGDVAMEYMLWASHRGFTTFDNALEINLELSRQARGSEPGGDVPPACPIGEGG